MIIVEKPGAYSPQLFEKKGGSMRTPFYCRMPNWSPGGVQGQSSRHIFELVWYVEVTRWTPHHKMVHFGSRMKDGAVERLWYLAEGAQVTQA